jgi:hypothetical protein
LFPIIGIDDCILGFTAFNPPTRVANGLSFFGILAAVPVIQARCERIFDLDSTFALGGCTPTLNDLHEEFLQLIGRQTNGVRSKTCIV